MPMNLESMALKQESFYPLVPVHPLISSRTLLAAISKAAFVSTSDKSVQAGLSSICRAHGRVCCNINHSLARILAQLT